MVNNNSCKNISGTHQLSSKNVRAMSSCNTWRKANLKYHPRKVVSRSNKNASKPVASSRYTTVEPSEEVLRNYGVIQAEQACEFFVSIEAEECKFENCEVCLNELKNGEAVSRMTRCVHEFHTSCITEAASHAQRCPICRVCGPKMEGNCPPGQMKWKINKNLKGKLAGYPNCDVIEIKYEIDNGVQDLRHPNPGKGYEGVEWSAFLPDNPQGRRVLELFKQAWKMKRTFTVGKSLALGIDNRVTWNDIHHKTNPYPNKAFGYPDPTYLTRVVEDMKAMGIQ